MTATTSLPDPVTTGEAATHRRIGTVLKWFLVIGVGVFGIVNTINHTVLADRTAELIGWPTGNPFQFEVAMANLTLGVLGLLCYRIHGNFWTATVIALATFYLGAAAGHIQQIVVEDNHATGNAGFPLYVDIALPLVLIGLLVAYHATAPDRGPRAAGGSL